MSSKASCFFAYFVLWLFFKTDFSSPFHVEQSNLACQRPGPLARGDRALFERTRLPPDLCSVVAKDNDNPLEWKY
jgi:hypothetical protein